MKASTEMLTVMGGFGGVLAGAGWLSGTGNAAAGALAGAAFGLVIFLARWFDGDAVSQVRPGSAVEKRLAALERRLAELEGQTRDGGG